DFDFLLFSTALVRDLCLVADLVGTELLDERGLIRNWFAIERDEHIVDLQPSLCGRAIGSDLCQFGAAGPFSSNHAQVVDHGCQSRTVLFRVNGCENDVGVLAVKVEADSPQFARGQALRQLFPGLSAVDALVDTGPLAVLAHRVIALDTIRRWWFAEK